MSENKPTPVRKLGEFGQLRLQEKTLRMQDIQGVPVIITDFAEEDGRFGKFFWLNVTLADGEKVKVRCGGSFIMDALREAKEAGALPVEATFVLRGNAWVVE
jgi:hypothetical protein